MHHNGTSIRGVAGFHPSQKSQEWGGILGYTVVRPRCELELADLPLLTGAILQRQKSTKSNTRYQHVTIPCPCCARRAHHRPSPGKKQAGESSPYEGRTFEHRMWPIQWYRVTSLESFHRCLYLGLASTGHTLSGRQEASQISGTNPYAAGEALPSCCYR